MKFEVTSSPHIRGKRTTQNIMLDVIIALVPTLIAGCIIFGMNALLVAAVCVAAAVAAEWLCGMIIYRRNTVKDLSACTVKGTNSILCLTNAQNGESKEEVTCIRCGECLKVCPMNLQPLYLYAYEKKEDVTALNRLNVLDCIECGCCSYACPGKLPLVERFRNGKRLVKEGNK